MRYFVFPLPLIFACLPLPHLGAQTANLDQTALDALDAAPETIAPRFIPKSAGKGPVVEKGREYVFTPKGTLAKAARVISMSDGSKVTAPLVSIPLLFKKNQAVLVDARSRANLQTLASKLRSLPNARFCIEGHASAEGTPARNQTLSALRAQAIRNALISLGVPAESFSSSVGLGSAYSRHPPDAVDSLRAEDRRVLVIREK